MERRPHVSQELLDALQKSFPNRCPTVDMNDREIWMAAGAAKVVSMLEQWHGSEMKRQLTG
jgi:hypothetical protein